MNTPRISLNITRYNYVKHLLEDSYDEPLPITEIVNVGKYTLAHLEGMQEFLNKEEDVTEYDDQMNHWHIKVPLASDKTKTTLQL